MTKERVQKILANAGVDSRRKCEDLIREGRVRVNGEIVTIGMSADSQIDILTVDGQKVTTKQQFYYLMMNKPTDYITTVSDMFERKTVVHLLPAKYNQARCYPIGRLDRDAEGLLLFTNDGEFANRVMHPRYSINKTYRAFLNEPFDDRHKATIESGMHLDDGWVKQMRLHKVDKFIVELTLHVGKHKIVKRIFNTLGYRVQRLIRIKIGDLELGYLKSGEVIELTESMLEKIFVRHDAKKDLKKVAADR